MTAATAYSPAALQIFDLFRSLPEPEKQNVCEKFVELRADFDHEIPDWHLEILEERERLAQAGLDQAIPAEQAFQYVREQLRKKRQAS